MSNDDMVVQLSCCSGLSVREIFMDVYRDPWQAQDAFICYMTDDDLPQVVIDYCVMKLARVTGRATCVVVAGGKDRRDREAERLP